VPIAICKNGHLTGYLREEEPSHEMQHMSSPTWCIHCGTFDLYCDSPCLASVRNGRFDSRDSTNWHRMFAVVFGIKSLNGFAI
jgi:hypothetical protein